MRKQTQLADLIASSGLVNGLAKRASSQDGSSQRQPVLYHFGPGSGSGGSKERDSRPQSQGLLPGGGPHPGASPGKPPPAPGGPPPWPAGRGAASHAHTRSTHSHSVGSNSGGVTAPDAAYHPRSNPASASGEAVPLYLGAGFLPPATGGAYDLLPPTDGSAVHTEYDQPHLALGRISQSDVQGAWHEAGAYSAAGTGPTFSLSGEADPHTGSGPLQHRISAPHIASPHSHGHSRGGRAVGAGARGGAGAGSGGGRRGGSRPESAPKPAPLHRSSSDSAVRGSTTAWVAREGAAVGGIAVTGTAGGAGGGVEGAWGAPASPSRGALGGGGGAGVGQAGDAGGGTLPAIRQGAAGAGETGGAWEAGDDGMVEEESSLDMPSAAGEAAGGAQRHAAQGAGASRPSSNGGMDPDDLSPSSSSLPVRASTVPQRAEAARAPVQAPATGLDGGPGPLTQWHGAAGGVQVPQGARTAGWSGTVGGDGFSSSGGGGSQGPSSEVLELRRMVAELTAQVSALGQQLRDSEAAAAQLQAAAASAAASGREAGEAEAARKHMKAVKAAEGARDKADTARRAAERRAKAADDELTALKGKLEAKTKQCTELEGSLSSAQAALERQRRGHEEALAALEAQQRAQAKKMSADLDSEKKGAQESLVKMQGDLARRNQTVLGLQADLEIATMAAAKKDDQLAELQATLKQLQEELEVERARAQEQDFAKQPKQHEVAEASQAGAPAAALASPKLARPGTAASPSSSSAASANTPTASTANAYIDEQTRAMRKMQTEVAAMREKYAERLVKMEEVVASCEAAMRDGTQGLERMFQVLVSRTAAVLAGRVGAAAGAGGGKSSGPGRPGTPGAAARGAAAAAAAAAGGPGGGAANAVLLQMNERLAAENAQLLGELSKWSSGRHAMLRKMGATVLGVEPPGPQPPPPTNAALVAAALQAVQPSGGGGAGGGGSAAAPPARTSTSGQSVSGASATGSGSGSAAAAPTPHSAAREALGVAAREVLLAGRKELLPAVMTAEGWGEGVAAGQVDAAAAVAAVQGGRAEAAVTHAEGVMRLRAQVLALQSEVARTRAAGGEQSERAREIEAMREVHEAALSEAKREVMSLKAQLSHTQRELERARAGIVDWRTGPSSGGGLDPAERERLEEAAAAAREDAARHRALLAAAKREAEARERAVDEAQLRHERLEAQLREARSETSRAEEGVKRLRLLLAQAKGLLKEQGVPFMEEDAGLDVLLQTAGGKAGGRAGLPPRPGTSAAHRASDGDGPLFKAVDAREREKEMSRLQGEVSDLQAQLGAANKELKRVRKQLEQQREAAVAAEREQRQALAGTIDGLAKEVAAGKEAAKGVHKQLQESQHECGELRRQLAELHERMARLKADSEYLRARAAAGKMKPKLSHARALSISVSGASTVAAGEG